MTRRTAIQRALLGVSSAALLVCACGVLESHNLVVLNNDLVIPATAGGTAEVSFLGLAGQTLTISLVGHKLSMVPYATLIGPNGGQVAAPPVSSAVDNTNTADVSLNQSGTYRLVVADSTGGGGAVTVRIER